MPSARRRSSPRRSPAPSPTWSAATESSDGYTGTVPEMVAELLGLPSVTFAKSIAIEGGAARCSARPKPATTTSSARSRPWCRSRRVWSSRGIPRSKGIMAAKSKPVDEVTCGDLGIDAGSVGWAGGGQEIVSVENAPAREAGEVIEDEGDAHERIVAFLEELRFCEG
ncbi:MAG: hypothetical protein R2695_04935 [Acidimicrobiales bacterium]